MIHQHINTVFKLIFIGEIDIFDANCKMLVHFREVSALFFEDSNIKRYKIGNIATCSLLVDFVELF